MQLFNTMWSPETQERLRILNSSWDASDEEWLERDNSDYEFRNAWDIHAMEWEAIGTLLKKGLYDVELLALYIATQTIRTWERYSDIIHNWQLSNKRAYDMWEYTYDTLMKYLEEHLELAPGP